MLVVGAGPAGLECAVTLGKRGYRVMLAEKQRELGGRVSRESRLPGLASWARVRDYRLGQIAKLSNIEVFRESDIAAGDVAAMECRHVILATGAEWLTKRHRPYAAPARAGRKCAGAVDAGGYSVRPPARGPCRDL